MARSPSRHCRDGAHIVTGDLTPRCLPPGRFNGAPAGGLSHARARPACRTGRSAPSTARHPSTAGVRAVWEPSGGRSPASPRRVPACCPARPAGAPLCEVRTGVRGHGTGGGSGPDSLSTARTCRARHHRPAAAVPAASGHHRPAHAPDPVTCTIPTVPTCPPEWESPHTRSDLRDSHNSHSSHTRGGPPWTRGERPAEGRTASTGPPRPRGRRATDPDRKPPRSPFHPAFTARIPAPFCGNGGKCAGRKSVALSVTVPAAIRAPLFRHSGRFIVR